MYFEDYVVGQKFQVPEFALSADEIIDFAKKYDPRDFHLSEEAGRKLVLGE